MSIIAQLASALGRNDEVPNQVLAHNIAQAHDAAAVAELVAHLLDRDAAMASDCIKVLYEVGALAPELLVDYSATFVHLLQQKNNRLVWGSMTALGAIAPHAPEQVAPYRTIIQEATQNGSVITQDWGVRVLAQIAAHSVSERTAIQTFLLDFLQHCPAKDLPRHAVSCLPSITPADRPRWIALLEQRSSELTPAQAKRLKPVLTRLRQ